MISFLPSWIFITKFFSCLFALLSSYINFIPRTFLSPWFIHSSPKLVGKYVCAVFINHNHCSSFNIVSSSACCCFNTLIFMLWQIHSSFFVSLDGNIYIYWFFNWKDSKHFTLIRSIRGLFLFVPNAIIYMRGKTCLESYFEIFVSIHGEREDDFGVCLNMFF